jgi:hypothetical protein
MLSFVKTFEFRGARGRESWNPPPAGTPLSLVMLVTNMKRPVSGVGSPIPIATDIPLCDSCVWTVRSLGTVTADDEVEQKISCVRRLSENQKLERWLNLYLCRLL